MAVSIVWTVGEARAGKKHQKYGDPYDTACTLYRMGDTVVVSGLVGSLTRSDLDGLRDALSRVGVKSIRFNRVRDGAVIQREIQTMKEPLVVEMKIVDSDGKERFLARWSQLDQKDVVELEATVGKSILEMGAKKVR